MLRYVMAVIVIVLAGCGGGGGGGSDDGASIAGMWSGTVMSTNGQTTEVLGVVSSENEMRLFASTLDIQYAGKVSVRGDQGSGTLRGYISDDLFYNDQPVADFDVSFTVVEGVSIQGQYVTQGDRGSFALRYSPGAERQSSLLDLVGTWGGYNLDSEWVEATIDNSGQISVLFSSGCEANGMVSLPSYDWSIYNATVSVTSCGEFNGSYSGLMHLREAFTSEELLWMMLSNRDFSYMDLMTRFR